MSVLQMPLCRCHTLHDFISDQQAGVLSKIVYHTPEKKESIGKFEL